MLPANSWSLILGHSRTCKWAPSLQKHMAAHATRFKPVLAEKPICRCHLLCPRKQLHSKLRFPKLFYWYWSKRWTPVGPFSLYLFFHAGSQETSPALPQKIRFVLKVDRSAGVLHYYQFLFPCTANEMCRNTCMYLQVSSSPFVRKAASSNRLQRAGSRSNFRRKKIY